jgi:hypothetical protein
MRPQMELMFTAFSIHRLARPSSPLRLLDRSSDLAPDGSALVVWRESRSSAD